MTSQMAGADAWTAANLIMIGIGAVLAVLVIWWGARLKRQRQATDAELQEQAEDAPHAPSPAPLVSASLDDIAPPAPETDPLPVAPSPPPLADTPVVATPAPAPPPEARATAADDLTLLKGVGAKLAARLGELGVTRFAQIAALTPADAEALDAQLGSFQGRMARDRWVEQAGYLANDDRAGFEAAFGKL